jgi:RNA polymerase sigma-70 factor (sigma-E family)
MDAEADDFESFFHARTPALLRWAYLLTGDRFLAEDLVQDALARTRQHWRKLRDGGSPDAYTRQVMYRLQASHWRRRRVRETLPGTLPERCAGGDPAPEIVDRLALREALLKLPIRQRTVIVLRYYEDRSEAEIAEIMGCRPGTVKSHATRGIVRLRELMPELSNLHYSEGWAR